MKTYGSAQQQHCFDDKSVVTSLCHRICLRVTESDLKHWKGIYCGTVTDILERKRKAGETSNEFSAHT